MPTFAFGMSKTYDDWKPPGFGRAGLFKPTSAFKIAIRVANQHDGVGTWVKAIEQEERAKGVVRVGGCGKAVDKADYCDPIGHRRRFHVAPQQLRIVRPVSTELQILG